MRFVQQTVPALDLLFIWKDRELDVLCMPYPEMCSARVRHAGRK